MVFVIPNKRSTASLLIRHKMQIYRMIDQNYNWS